MPATTATPAPTLWATSAGSSSYACPSSRASVSVTSSPSEACPRCAKPLALPGRLASLSAGKDTTVGHWEHMGLVTAAPFPTYPDGFPGGGPRSVQSADRPGGAGQQDGVGHGDHRRTGRGAPGQRASRSSTRRPTACSRSPRTSTWCLWSSSTRGARSPAGSSRDRMPSPGSSPGRSREAGGVRPHQGPARLLPGAPGSHLSRPAPRSRRAGAGAWARSARCSWVAGSGPTIKVASNDENLALVRDLLRHRSDRGRFDEGLLFTNLVDFDMVWGHRNDVDGFAGGWRRSTRALPAIVASLAAGRWPDHHRPTTESTPPRQAPTTAASTCPSCCIRGRRPAPRPSTRARWPTPVRRSTQRSREDGRRSGETSSAHAARAEAGGGTRLPRPVPGRTGVLLSGRVGDRGGRRSRFVSARERSARPRRSP